MDDSAAWSALPKRWLHIQLPNYRSLPEPHTYEGSSLDELPPIPIELDDNCEWLITHGTTYAHGALNEYERDIQPTSRVWPIETRSNCLGVSDDS